MQVDVIKLDMRPGWNRIGQVIVGYYELKIDMDLVIYEPQQKLWLRMPEVWKGDFKKRYCFWPCTEVSDRFQEAVLTILHEKHGITFSKMYEQHVARKLKKAEAKKPVQITKK